MDDAPPIDWSDLEPVAIRSRWPERYTWKGLQWKAEPVRVIFCDFDGVLNDVPFGYATPVLEEDMVERLSLLAAETDSHVVISSYWRHRGVSGCRQALRKAGFTGKVIGRTPWRTNWQTGSPVRGNEIQEVVDWLGGRLQGMVILDDNNRMSHLKPWQVRTDGKVGLTDKDIYAAMEVLKEAPATTRFASLTHDVLSFEDLPAGRYKNRH